MKSWPAAGLGLGRGKPSIQPAAASKPRLNLWGGGGAGAQSIQKVHRGHNLNSVLSFP